MHLLEGKKLFAISIIGLFVCTIENGLFSYLHTDNYYGWCPK